MGDCLYDDLTNPYKQLNIFEFFLLQLPKACFFEIIKFFHAY